MKNSLKRFMQDESGVTALETAIILIAFVVVAAVFAFTILTTGTFLTERSKEAAYQGLAEVRGTMEMRGSVVAKAAGATVDNVTFSVSTVAGGTPVDLTDTAAAQVVKLSYRDKAQALDLNTPAAWTVAFVGKNNGDKILDPGELAEITVDLTGLTTALPTNTTFDIEVKPPQGGVLLIERTTPARIDPVTDLK